MEAQAVEAILAEPFGELPAVLRLGEAGVTRHIRAEKAQRDVAVIDEMTVLHADKSMGTSGFRCQITDIHGRAGRRFKAWNFKSGPAGRVRRDLCTDGEAHQQGDGVQIFHHAFLFWGWILPTNNYTMYMVEMASQIIWRMRENVLSYFDDFILVIGRAADAVRLRCVFSSKKGKTA